MEATVFSSSGGTVFRGRIRIFRRHPGRADAAHHPAISFLFDFCYATELMPEAGGWPDLHDYYDYLREHDGFQAAKLVIAAGLDYPRLVDSFLEQKGRRDRKPLVGATVRRHFDRVANLARCTVHPHYSGRRDGPRR